MEAFSKVWRRNGLRAIVGSKEGPDLIFRLQKLYTGCGKREQLSFKSLLGVSGKSYILFKAKREVP